MGRGSRTPSELALAPLPLTSDQRWLGALTQFEHTTFHSPGEAACEIPYTYDAPAFVVVSTPHLVESPVIKHTFTYYTTPKALLESLLVDVRRLTTNFQHMFAYQPANATFSKVATTGIINGYTPPLGLASKERASRVRAITASYGLATDQAIHDTSRFFVALRYANVGVLLSATNSFIQAEDMCVDPALTTNAFVALYDLDVSDQPIPIRFTFQYVDSKWVTHSADEVL